MALQNTTDIMYWGSYNKDRIMRNTKDTKLTIRLSKDEKDKLQREAKRMHLDTSKFIRQHFIQLISEKWGKSDLKT